jgi:V8-like Glu-specific endopeptidase
MRDDEVVDTVFPLPWWATVLILALTPLVWGCATTPAYDVPRGAVRLISNETGNGSAVVIAPNLVLTAAHVAVVQGLKIGDREAKALRISQEADIAVMGVEVGCPCATIADRPVEVDEPVLVVGFPYHMHFGAQVVTFGRAQSIQNGHMVLTAAALPGNSGGGVFARRDGQWQLVGILVAGHPGGTLTIAVDLVSIRKFLVA